MGAKRADTGADTDADTVVPRSVGRVLDLLEVVLARPSCNLTTAATAVDLTPTTARRHLRALEARGYVDRDDNGQFSPGPTMYRLAAALHDSGPLERLVATAQPYLDELATTTGESAYLAVSDGTTATYIATAESNRAIRHVGWVGQNVTLDDTAVGSAFAHPGSIATRTGAVEPDTTAICLALVGAESLDVAVSVIGPAHRLVAAERRKVEHSLLRMVERLTDDLGLTTTPGEELAS